VTGAIIVLLDLVQHPVRRRPMPEHAVTWILALLVVGYWLHVAVQTCSRNGIVSDWQRREHAAALRRRAPWVKTMDDR
jgi:uncharacterized membrane protein